jgi:hypothetical protein
VPSSSNSPTSTKAAEPRPLTATSVPLTAIVPLAEPVVILSF